MTRPPRAAPFDPAFLQRSPLFWPVLPAARSLLESSQEGAPDFPPVQSLDRVFGADRGDAPVRFVPAAPRPRRGRRPPAIDVSALYDARITLDRVVPTRARSWHDLMNALVWGTFPRAKSALHARQHRAIAERVVPGARTLPSARTRELDALALLDEGGVVLPGGDVSRAVVFGHAIYESLALGVPPAVVAAIAIDADSRTPRAVDEALARHIEDSERLRSPEELTRVELPV
ncbi:MAG TPA: DUF3025 domain-containing protein [Polyangiaceae bacterium]|nr:DUF3025 domain-containing protein [Polyangiaceae bacterium]